MSWQDKIDWDLFQERLHHKVKGFCFKYRRIHEYDDVFGYVQLHLTERAQNYDPKILSFSLWLNYHISKLVIEYLRSQKEYSRRRNITYQLLSITDDMEDYLPVTHQPFPRQTWDTLAIILTPKEMEMLYQHYIYGLTFTHISEMAGKSRARASQIHKGILNKIRRQCKRDPQFNQALMDLVGGYS